MAQPAKPGTGRALVPSNRARAAIVKRLTAQTGRLATEVVAEIERRHAWYRELGAQERSWISLLASNGINCFVKWFEDDTAADVSPQAIFRSAPRSLARAITLRQTVDLVRTTIDVVENQISQTAPRGDRQALRTAIVHYSREVAFASAEIYAGSAESRVSWDEKMEAMIVDAIVRSDYSGELLSRAATLGWDTRKRVLVAVGTVKKPAELAEASMLHTSAEKLGLWLAAGQLKLGLIARASWQLMSCWLSGC